MCFRDIKVGMYCGICIHKRAAYNIYLVICMAKYNAVICITKYNAVIICMTAYTYTRILYIGV